MVEICLETTRYTKVVRNQEWEGGSGHELWPFLTGRLSFFLDAVMISSRLKIHCTFWDWECRRIALECWGKAPDNFQYFSCTNGRNWPKITARKFPFSLIIGIVLAWNKSKISQGTVENLSKGKNHSKYFSSSSSDFIVQKINIMTFWPSLHILNKTLRCTKPKLNIGRKSRFFSRKKVSIQVHFN